MRVPRALIMGASSFHFCFAASSSAAHIAESFFWMACADVGMTYSRPRRRRRGRRAQSANPPPPHTHTTRASRRHHESTPSQGPFPCPCCRSWRSRIGRDVFVAARVLQLDVPWPSASSFAEHSVDVAPGFGDAVRGRFFCFGFGVAASFGSLHPPLLLPRLLPSPLRRRRFRRVVGALREALDRGRSSAACLAPALAARRRRRERSTGCRPFEVHLAFGQDRASHALEALSARLLRSSRAEDHATSLQFRIASGVSASGFFVRPKQLSYLLLSNPDTRAQAGIHRATMPQCWIVLGVIYASVSLERYAARVRRTRRQERLSSDVGGGSAKTRTMA